MGGLCLVLLLYCYSWCPFSFCNHLADEKKAGCFTLIVSLLSYDCKCSVALPRDGNGRNGSAYGL